MLIIPWNRVSKFGADGKHGHSLMSQYFSWSRDCKPSIEASTTQSMMLNFVNAMQERSLTDVKDEHLNSSSSVRANPFKSVISSSEEGEPLLAVPQPKSNLTSFNADIPTKDSFSKNGNSLKGGRISIPVQS
jgi:hypothetical protein